MTADSHFQPKSQGRDFVYELIGDRHPDILTKLLILDEALAAEETYRRMVECSIALWSEMKADIAKLDVSAGEELFEASNQVKDLATDLLFHLNRYTKTITTFHGQVVGGTYLKMIIAFRNFYEHGKQILPLVYKHSTRTAPGFEWALGIDLVLLMERLTSGKRRLRSENIKRIDDLLVSLGEFANLSDLFEKVVFNAVSNYPVVAENIAAETESAIRDLGGLRQNVEDDEMKQAVLEVIDDHMAGDRLRAERAEANAELAIDIS